ncbi:MAG: hypothetical protein HY921_03695 [Elusimicrobia bacterium]|nr:hypothetical protein [Elusimicrobiota bacterium]
MMTWILPVLLAAQARAVDYERPGIWTLGEAKRRFEAPSPIVPTAENLKGPWVLVAEVASGRMIEDSYSYLDPNGQWTKYQAGKSEPDKIHGQFEPQGLTRRSRATFPSQKAFLDFTGVRSNLLARGLNLWSNTPKSIDLTVKFNASSAIVHEGESSGYPSGFYKGDYSCRLDGPDSLICLQHLYYKYKCDDYKEEWHELTYHGFSRSSAAELAKLTGSRDFRRKYREGIHWGKTNHFPMTTGAETFNYKAGKTVRPTNLKLVGSWRMVSETSVKNPDGRDRFEGLQDDLGDVIHLVFTEEPTSVGVPTLLASLPNLDGYNKDLVCSVDPKLVRFSREGINSACGLVQSDTLACETSAMVNRKEYDRDPDKWEKQILGYTIYIKEPAQ